MMIFSKANRLLPVCAFLVAAGIGFITAGRREPARDKTPISSLPANISEEAKLALAPVLAAASAEDRQRAAIVLAGQVPVAAMMDWLDGSWYPFDDGLDSLLFYRILSQRGLNEDPAALASLSLARKTGDLGEVIRRWTNRDPEGVVAWIWQIKDPEALRRMAPFCFDRVVVDKPLLALAQVSIIHERLGGSTSSWLAELLVAISKDHRDAIVHQMPAWPESLRAVARQALNIRQGVDDFPAIIAKMKTAPDGLDQFVAAISSADFGGRVLEHAAIVPKEWISAAAWSGYEVFLVMDVDPKFWLDTDLAALGLSDTVVSKFLDLGMSGLIDRDPEQAIKLLKRPTLRPNDRRNILSNGFLRLATRDPARALECLAELTDPKEIAAAKKTVKNSGAPEPTAPLKLTPREWMAAFSGQTRLPRDQVRSSLEWSAKTTPVLREEFSRLTDQQKAIVAFGSVMLDQGSMGNIRGDLSALTWLRADGIAYYLKHPPKRQDPGMSDGRDEDLLILRFAIGWTLEDPASASRWAQEDLPLGPQRITVMKNVADYWLKYQPTAASEWISSLPQGELEQIEAYLRGFGKHLPS